MIGRRAGLLGAATAALGGCGFRPLYLPAPGNASADAQLAAIYVAVMPERPGQLLRQALQRRFDGTGEGVAKLYELTGNLGIAGEGIAIQRDNSTTRLRFVGTATWALRKLDLQHTALTQGSARVLDGANVFNQEYFALDQETESVTRRLAESCADQVTLQVATFLRRQVAKPA